MMQNMKKSYVVSQEYIVRTSLLDFRFFTFFSKEKL